METVILEAAKAGALGQAFIAVLVLVLLKLVWDLRGQLMKLNGQVGKLNTWSVQHEKDDDRRLTELRESVRDQWKHIETLRIQKDE